ncbi:MAG: CBS domain-containing protein [Candidatus Verstraetearchaeota archaeon]|nr:CBS domain-containing protein [Candidatus Verstraetearchaeota archaeon]
MSLSAPQKEIVVALIELYDKKRSLVKSKEIAARTGRDEGTVRNIMPVLRAIGLVEAIPGPRGGYIPTNKAYESFNVPKSSRSLSVPIYTKRGEKTEVTVTDILFKSVFSPDFCQAILKVIGNISRFDINEEIVIGPTPSGRMIIEGKIAGRDDLHGEILLDVITLISIPKVKVNEVMSKRIVSIPSDAPLKAAAEVLYREMIRAAPVIENGKVVGMITSSDISRCVSEGRTHITTREAATRKPVLIGMDDDILQSMEKMQRSSIGRLVVVDSEEKPVGIITRTDILLRILKPFEMIETRGAEELLYPKQV